MELFWYNTACTECDHLTEKTFQPSREKNYGENYFEFATEMERLSWLHNAKGWREHCEHCKKETLHQLNSYAPAYRGVE